MSLLLVLLLFLTQCGKVTQEIDAKKKDQRNSFGIQTQLIIDDAIESLVPTASRFIQDEPELVAVVLGVFSENRPKRLSWGKTVRQSSPIDEDLKDDEFEADISSDSLELDAQYLSYNVSGLSIQKTNLYETLIRFSQVTKNVQSFSIDASKIKLGYDFYILSVYAGPQKYYFYPISEKQASDNAVVLVDRLDPYQSFISTLYLMHINQNLFDESFIQDYEKIKSVFPDSFFKLLSYQRPTVIQKEFNINDPYFDFKGSFEDSLLLIYDLIQLKEFDSIEDEINKLDISKEAKSTLWNHIDTKIIQLTPLDDDSSVTPNQETEQTSSV